MTVLGIDPGPEQTAFAWFDGTRVGLNGIVSNDEMLALLAQPQTRGANIYCEDIASYGMAVGASVFSTCLWIGRSWPRCVDHRFNASVEASVFRLEVRVGVGL